jgi:hypothetical protein
MYKTLCQPQCCKENLFQRNVVNDYLNPGPTDVFGRASGVAQGESQSTPPTGHATDQLSRSPRLRAIHKGQTERDEQHHAQKVHVNVTNPLLAKEYQQEDRGEADGKDERHQIEHAAGPDMDVRYQACDRVQGIHIGGTMGTLCRMHGGPDRPSRNENRQY